MFNGINDVSLQKRLSVLKKEAKKKLIEAGQYKSPQADLANDYKMNPDKDRVKTEIKLASKNLKNLFSDANDIEDDLNLGSIFDDEPEEEIEKESLDSVLAELEDGEEQPVEEGCGCKKAEDETEEIAETVEKAADEEPAVKVEAKLSRIARRIRSLKGKKINEEVVEDLKAAEKETESDEVSKRLLAVIKRVRTFNEEGMDEPENDEIVEKLDEAADEEPNAAVEARLRKVANRIRSLKNKKLKEEDIEAIEDSTEGSEDVNVVNKIGKLVKRLKKNTVKKTSKRLFAEEAEEVIEEGCDCKKAEDEMSDDSEELKSLFEDTPEDEEVAADSLDSLFSEDEVEKESDTKEEEPVEESCKEEAEEKDIDDVEITSDIDKKLNNIIEDLQTIKVNQIKHEAMMDLKSIFAEDEEADSEEKAEEVKEEEKPEEGDEILNSIFSEDEAEKDSDEEISERIDALFAEIDDSEDVAEETVDSITEDNFANDNTIAEESEENEITASLNALFEDEPVEEEDLQKSLNSLFEEDEEINIDEPEMV